MVQPWPNGNRSWWTLASPHSVNRFIAHCDAASRAGVPVARGPCTSESHQTWSIACDFSVASARMRAMVARSRAAGA